MKLLGFDESSRAVDSGDVDFTIVNFDYTLWPGTPIRTPSPLSL